MDAIDHPEETFTLTITRMGQKGDGLGIKQMGEEMAPQIIAVPGTLPNERIRVSQSHDNAPNLLEIIEKSEDRREPICKYFGTCGGCKLQHWAPAATGLWKQSRVKEALDQYKLSPSCLEATREVYGAGRRRITLHIRQKEGKVQAGFMAEGSHELIEIDTCPILVPALATYAPEIARGIGHVMRGINKPMDVHITAADQGLDVDLRGVGKLPEALRQKLIIFALEHRLARLSLHGERIVEPTPPSIRFEDAPELSAFLPPGAFLQATAMAEATLAALAEEGLAKSRHVLELFCGLGPFGLRLAQNRKVTAFDVETPAIEAFNRSIRAHPGRKPILAQRRDLFRRPLYVPEMKDFDAVLLDPPRQGAEAAIREIAKSAINRVVYIACDPMSFARDATILGAAGFKLGRVVPLDAFRFSAHVELIAFLER